MSTIPLILPSVALALSAGRHEPAEVSLLTAEGPWSSLTLENVLSSRAAELPRDPRQALYGRNGPYVQFGFGVTTTEDSDGPGEEVNFDEGYAVPLALGYRFGAEDTNPVSFDLELEGLFTDQDADDSGVLQAVDDVTVLAGLVNGVLDLALGPTFSLYGGAGVGAAGLDVGTRSDSFNSFDEEDGPFLAWQGKAGLRWWASQTVSWSLGYRFLNIDDAEIDDDLGGASFDLQTEQHVIELGLRFGGG